MNYNWTIIWNGRRYHSGQVSLKFIVWLVGNEKFTLILEGEEFEDVEISYDGYGYFATVMSRHDGLNGYRGISLKSRAKAVELLVENLSESILSKVKVA